jgi:tetratricopeptide (TPR) repeat protein
MRAFLSHSSLDKAIVIDVQKGLEAESTWLDRAEIEWGEMFLERIAEGVASATDFVLFWSKNASKSEWVRLEVNMAFLQALRRKAIRLRVVVLDDTPLPLYLEPYQAFSVVGSTSPISDILQKLKALLKEAPRSVRSRFVNRHDETAKIEAAVDDPDFRAVCAFGFTGVGKSSTIQEGLQRIFAGASIVRIDVSEGTGFVELALALSASVLRETLPESLSKEQLDGKIRLCVETVVKNGQLLLLSNVQHWLDEDSQPQGPLTSLLTIVSDLPALSSRPVFMTSTRRPNLDVAIQDRVMQFSIRGLKDEHIAALVRNWYFAIYDKELPMEDSDRIAPKLYGHPVAARLVAGLLGDHSADFLEKYPEELVALRRDLARVLLQDLKLTTAAEKLMETLALAGIGLPASVLVAAGSSDTEFQQAVAQCANAGLITADRVIETHPLFHDFFWHRLHRSDYRQRSLDLAEALRLHINGMDKTAPEFATLLPVIYRSYALGGEIGKANALRHDLSGELEAAALTLYNRRDYQLADQYISAVLESNPKNWRMRLYRGRIRVRKEEWKEAERIFAGMLEERPLDVGVLHAMGWSQLKQRNWSKALQLFTAIIAKREHVRSLVDAGECLHRLNRNEEALEFLARAKEQESENAYALDLESRILEDIGELDAAYDSAELAAARDPLNERYQNRLGVIRARQKRPQLAIPHFKSAIVLDPDRFSPANSLAAAYLEIDEWELADGLLSELEKKARTPSDFALLAHTKARVAFAKGELDESKDLLKAEIAASRNVIPNLGVLINVLCSLFDSNYTSFPAIASVELNEAENALKKISELDPSNEFLDSLRRNITDRQVRQKPIRRL